MVDRELLLERDEPTDAGPDHHRATRRIRAGIAGVGERVGRGREAELRDAIDAARFLRTEIRSRVEVGDLTADTHRQERRVEALNRRGG